MDLMRTLLCFSLLLALAACESDPPAPEGPTYDALTEQLAGAWADLDADLERFALLADAQDGALEPPAPLDPAPFYERSIYGGDDGENADFLVLQGPGAAPRFVAARPDEPAPDLPFIVTNRLGRVLEHFRRGPDAYPPGSEEAPRFQGEIMEAGFALRYLGAVRVAEVAPVEVLPSDPDRYLGGLAVLDGLLYDRQTDALVCAVQTVAEPDASLEYEYDVTASPEERAREASRAATRSLLQNALARLFSEMQRTCGGTFSDGN